MLSHPRACIHAFSQHSEWRLNLNWFPICKVGWMWHPVGLSDILRDVLWFKSSRCSITLMDNTLVNWKTDTQVWLWGIILIWERKTWLILIHIVFELTAPVYLWCNILLIYSHMIIIWNVIMRNPLRNVCFKNKKWEVRLKHKIGLEMLFSWCFYLSRHHHFRASRLYLHSSFSHSRRWNENNQDIRATGIMPECTNYSIFLK